MSTLSGPILSMNMAAASDLAAVLHDKVAALQTLISNKTTSVDNVSDHTWYGIPESITDDMNQAINLVEMMTAKINTVA